MRVQVLPATRNQLVVTHSGEPRYLLAVRASEWFARVAAPGRCLADQPDLVRLDLFVFHVNNSNGQLCKLVDGNSKPLCGRPLAACFVTRGHLENRAGRKHAFQAPFRFYGKAGTKFPKNCSGRLVRPGTRGKLAPAGCAILIAFLDHCRYVGLVAAQVAFYRVLPGREWTRRLAHARA